MKFKVVPAPRSLAFVERAREALPLVPRPEEDCVARLLEATDLGSRDQARAWLTFLRALGLARKGESGFHRTRDAPDREALARRFCERVYGADDALDALQSAGPLTPGEVADRLAMPKWERDRRADPEMEWRKRTERVLGWLVEVGLATTSEDGYGAEG